MFVFPAHSPVWIGLNDIDNFAGHRMFRWSDNSPVTFTNWAKGEPNNYKGKQNCVAMNRDKVRQASSLLLNTRINRFRGSMAFSDMVAQS